MPSYIPHPSLAGLQAGNDLGLAALRSLDNQTSNYTNNFAMAQREREKRMMDAMMARDFLDAGLNAQGSGPSPLSAGTKMMFPGLMELFGRGAGARLGMDQLGVPIPGVPSAEPRYALPIPKTLVGPGVNGVPSAADWLSRILPVIR